MEHFQVLYGTDCEAIVWYLLLAMKAKDSIEHVLDRLNDIREELLSLERELERVEAMRRDGSGEPAPLPPSA